MSHINGIVNSSVRTQNISSEPGRTKLINVFKKSRKIMFWLKPQKKFNTPKKISQNIFAFWAIFRTAFCGWERGVNQNTFCVPDRGTLQSYCKNLCPNSMLFELVFTYHMYVSRNFSVFEVARYKKRLLRWCYEWMMHRSDVWILDHLQRNKNIYVHKGWIFYLDRSGTIIQ